MEVRKNLGYMTQAFSLYGELTVRQNLVLHARLYHLPPDKAKARIDELVERFGLGPHLDALADDAADGPAPAAVAGGRRAARAADPDPRRADVGRRSGRARQLLGAADRSVAQAGRDDLRDDALHERGDALRSHLAHERGQGAGLRRAAEADRRARRRQPGGRLHRLHGGRDRRRGGAARRKQGRRRRRPSRRPAAAGGRRRRREAVRLAAAPRPDARLRAQRDDADPPRSGAAGLRLRRLGAADARLRLRHHHRRRAHSLRRARSRSVAGEPRLSRAVRGDRPATSPARRRSRSADEALQAPAVGRRLAGRSRSRRTSAATSAAAPARRSWRRSTAR